MHCLLETHIIFIQIQLHVRWCINIYATCVYIKCHAFSFISFILQSFTLGFLFELGPADTLSFHFWTSNNKFHLYLSCTISNIIPLLLVDTGPFMIPLDQQTFLFGPVTPVKVILFVAVDHLRFPGPQCQSEQQVLQVHLEITGP